MNLERLVINRNLKASIEEYKARLTQQNNASVITNTSSAISDATNNTNSITNNAQTLPTHIELLEKLSNELKVNAREVYVGSIVEQTLVALAGVYTSQSDSMFKRDNTTGKTSFWLNFKDNQKYQRFIDYYNQNHPRVITEEGGWSTEKTKVSIDTSYLYNVLSQILGNFKENGHTRTMEELASRLGVEFNDVYTGSAVERRLVGLAGVDTQQNNSCYRRRQDYSTQFSLSFNSNEQYNQFKQYFQNNFPNFIIESAAYSSTGLTNVNVSTQILTTNVAPLLTVVLENVGHSSTNESSNVERLNQERQVNNNLPTM